MKVRGSKINKWLDFYVGIPLLALTSIFISKRPRPGKISRVLIIQFGTIGDAILGLPAIEEFRKSGAEVLVLASRANQQIFDLASIPTLVFEVGDFLKHPLSVIATIHAARKYSANLVIDFIPWLRLSAFVSMLVRTRESFSIGFKTTGQFKHFAFDRAVIHRNDQHESQNYMSLAQSPLGQNSESPVILNRLTIDTNDAIPAAPFIVLHPWSGGYRGRDKEWSLENYLILDSILPPEYSIVVTGTSEDSSRADILKNFRRFKIVAGSLTLKETAALMAHAKFIVTVNTGILHLGSWLGKNLICLNGPAGSLRWGGLLTHDRQQIVNLNAEVPCAPCLNLGFDYGCKKMFCMPTISKEKFKDAIQMMLAISLGAEPHKPQYAQPKFQPQDLPTGLHYQDPLRPQDLQP